MSHIQPQHKLVSDALGKASALNQKAWSLRTRAEEVLQGGDQIARNMQNLSHILEGMLGYLHGVCKERVPYTPATTERSYWEQGWDLAEGNDRRAVGVSTPHTQIGEIEHILDRLVDILWHSESEKVAQRLHCELYGIVDRCRQRDKDVGMTPYLGDARACYINGWQRAQRLLPPIFRPPEEQAVAAKPKPRPKLLFDLQKGQVYVHRLCDMTNWEVVSYEWRLVDKEQDETLWLEVRRLGDKETKWDRAENFGRYAPLVEPCTSSPS